MSETIQHKGIIIAIKHSKAKVQIDTPTACSGCHAESVCHTTSSSTKEIEVSLPSENFEVGDLVELSMSTKMGFKALFYAYVLPLLTVLLVMFLLKGVLNDILLASFSLLLIIIYFFSFYIRGKNVYIEFEVKKIK